ncbi:hypothetical protein GYMLUDRAFT_240426 [Collybiopsis luxurians FD-317 M1]|nr:hypothetical protein GYMLUDRAFT_240426 [Collybiopsis luxurians FD-317 M1]
MLFARFFALSFLFATLGLVSAASVAAPVQKRQGAQIVSILDTLLDTLNTVEPQLAAIQQAGNATDANVTPLVNEVAGALQAAAGEITSLLNPFNGLKRRQFASEIDTLLGEITSVAGVIVSILQTFVTVQNIETLITLVSDGLELATNAIKLAAAICSLAGYRVL